MMTSVSAVPGEQGSTVRAIAVDIVDHLLSGFTWLQSFVSSHISEIATLATVLLLALTAYLTYIAIRNERMPRIACFLRPWEPSTDVCQFVVSNDGGTAYELEYEIDCDEEDFQRCRVWTKKRGTGTHCLTVRTGQEVSQRFGSFFHLVDGEDRPDRKPLKPFTVTVNYKWKHPLPKNRLVRETEVFIVDVEAFARMNLDHPLNSETAEAIKDFQSMFERRIKNDKVFFIRADAVNDTFQYKKRVAYSDPKDPRDNTSEEG